MITAQRPDIPLLSRNSLISTGVTRERMILNFLRTNSGAWETILPQEFLERDSSWTRTNYIFVPTSAGGTLNLEVLKSKYTSDFDLIVSDLDGAVRSPYIRSKIWRDRHVSSQRSDHSILELLNPTGECIFYSANTLRRSKEDHVVIQSFGKFFGQNQEVVSLIIYALEDNKKVLYFGSSDFDTQVVIQVLLELKAQLFNAKCSLAKTKRDRLSADLSSSESESVVQTILKKYSNFYYASPSRKLV